ncbi:uncharacterized protein LOC144715910 [Wolffia australiana]
MEDDGVSLRRFFADGGGSSDVDAKLEEGLFSDLDTRCREADVSCKVNTKWWEDDLSSEEEEHFSSHVGNESKEVESLYSDVNTKSKEESHLSSYVDIELEHPSSEVANRSSEEGHHLSSDVDTISSTKKDPPPDAPAASRAKRRPFLGGGKAGPPRMPILKTTGKKGRTVTGMLYRYTAAEISIVCVCHGSVFSPAGFVKHAGGSDRDAANPLPHISVVLH